MPWGLGRRMSHHRDVNCQRRLDGRSGVSCLEGGVAVPSGIGI